MRISDWSSDVCSSDLERFNAIEGAARVDIGQIGRQDQRRHGKPGPPLEPHLPQQRADQAVRQIIHRAIRGRWTNITRKAAAAACYNSGPSSFTVQVWPFLRRVWRRSEEHTSELQSLMRRSYAVLCMNKN